MRIRIAREELDDLIGHLESGVHPRCRWNEQELIDRLARDLKDARHVIGKQWLDSESKLIYLATPYNHPDPAIREERFLLACLAAATLMQDGVHLFCPIAHTHPIALQGNLPCGWDYWQEYDRLMLAACDELWIVQMDGWDRSEGIKGEIEIAKELGKRMFYLDPVSLERRDRP